MKIAIHQEEGSFSDRWISYCKAENISYKTVSCYDSDIISQLSDCDGLMWHWTLSDYKSSLFANQLFLSLEKKGISIFPNVDTCWHYDDKLGQKYLLEAIDAPLVQSYVFYTKREALEWLETTTFPKVFKLRGGAASVNVSLVKTKQEAQYLINKAFGRGFSPVNRINRLKNRIWEFRRVKTFSALKKVITGVARIFIPNEVEIFSNIQKGYIYFQDFIPENKYDIRLFVIGEKCFGIRRFCRDGDFRASGSGLFDPNPYYINKKCIDIAFKVANKLESQSIAFDFLLDGQNPKIIEISYCFPTEGPDICIGYWDENLVWYEEKINAEIFIIKAFIEKCNKISNIKLRQKA